MSAGDLSQQCSSRQCPAESLILVVDDDRSVCDLTASMLELHGYQVLRAASGQEALQLFQSARDRVSLLVIDIVMPAMSGPTIAQQLKAVRPSLPVLFISGLVSHGNFQGVMGGWFLRKPYTQHLLISKVKEVLDGSAS